MINEIHASNVSSWLQCSYRESEYAKRSVNRDFPTHVGTEFGNMVHHEITGHEFIPAKKIAWDGITRNEKELNRQVKMNVEATQEALDKHGINIKDTEVSYKAEIFHNGMPIEIAGTVDIETAKGVIDLKTGVYPPSNVWVQMSIYAWLSNRNWKDTQDAIVVWAPRQKIDSGKVQKVVVTKRAANKLLELAPVYIKTVIRNRVKEPVPTPGMWCTRCDHRNDCAAYWE